MFRSIRDSVVSCNPHPQRTSRVVCVPWLCAGLRPGAGPMHGAWALPGVCGLWCCCWWLLAGAWSCALCVRYWFTGILSTLESVPRPPADSLLQLYVTVRLVIQVCSTASPWWQQQKLHRSRSRPHPRPPLGLALPKLLAECESSSPSPALA